MEIRFDTGLGSIEFGMSPAQVMAIMGEEQTYENWMGGNRNDCLLYPCLLFYFDLCDGSGPLPHAKLIELDINSHPDVTYQGVPIFGQSTQQIAKLLNETDTSYDVRHIPKSNEVVYDAPSFEFDFEDNRLTFLTLYDAPRYMLSSRIFETFLYTEEEQATFPYVARYVAWVKWKNLV